MWSVLGAQARELRRGGYSVLAQGGDGKGAREGAVGIEGERVSQATADDARAYSIWTRLEREFVFGESRGAGGVLLPRHSRARFLEFVHWMAADSTRAAHLEDVRRAVSVFVPETRLADWSADREVAEELRRLIEGRRERESIR